METVKATTGQRIAVVKKAVKNQSSKKAEANLLLSVFEQALDDAFANNVSKTDRDTAFRYLDGDMIHLEICGIESGWVKRIMKEVGLTQ